MGPNETHPSDQRHTVRADTLDQVEPENAAAFWVRPYSLTDAELGGLPAVLASEPIPIRAWVRYPATAEQVHGLALAWSPRAVYVEWEGEGTHRAWVWASAVERAAASKTGVSSSPPRPQAHALTVRETGALVVLVNDELSVSGSEFVTAMAQPAGPFGAVVFGSIEGHAVRLEFFVDPETDRCAVHLFDMTAKKVLAEQVPAATFEKAIEGYPWDAAIDALGAL
jgi:hypothetical protein